MKKRQEIGRGLRLPVDQNGVRVFDESVNKLYVMANESYEDFARALADRVRRRLRRHLRQGAAHGLGQADPGRGWRRAAHRARGGRSHPRGPGRAEDARRRGRIQPAFDPKRKDFKLELPRPSASLTPAVIDLLSSYQIERHIRRERDEGPNRLKKEVTLSPEFQALWDRIKPKTTYRVEFETDELGPTVRWTPSSGWRRSKPPRSGSRPGRWALPEGASSPQPQSVGRGTGRPTAVTRAARRAGLPAERDRADPLDARPHPQGVRPAGGVLQQPAALHGRRGRNPQVRAAPPAGGRHQVRAD